MSRQRTWEIVVDSESLDWWLDWINVPDWEDVGRDPDPPADSGLSTVGERPVGRRGRLRGSHGHSRPVSLGWRRVPFARLRQRSREKPSICRSEAGTKDDHSPQKLMLR